MSKKAKEILELHMGADYWRLEKTDYFANLINAVDEALSITDVSVSVLDFAIWLEQQPPHVQKHNPRHQTRLYIKSKNEL